MAKRRNSLQPVTGPDLGPILKIHRGENSYVRFSRLEAGKGLRPIAHFKVGDLEQLFPEFQKQLVEDAFFSLNSFFRPGTARTADLRYLNVAYSDLDYYKAGTDRAAALAGIVRAQDADLIPPASILADSGRGLYAFWLLVSPTEPGQPERYYRNFPEKLERYRRVQMALHKTLKRLEPALEPDPQAIDASRIVRVPGSVNSRSHRPVQYWIQAGPDQLGYAYTLRNLEDHFGLELAEPVQARQILKWGGQKRIAANRSGYRALHAARLGDLEHLWERRKGFRQGHRNFAALIYACTLRGYRTEDNRKLSDLEIRQRIEELAADCSPALSRGEVAKALESSEKRYRWSDEQIILHLEIAPEELETLSSIQADRPPRLKAGPKPKKIKAERQAQIIALIEGPGFAGRKPSYRGMARELKAHGFDVSHVTVGKDYRELGLSGPQLEIDYTSPFLEVVEREPGAVAKLAEALSDLRGVIDVVFPETPELDADTIAEYAKTMVAYVLELTADTVAKHGALAGTAAEVADRLGQEADQHDEKVDELLPVYFPPRFWPAAAAVAMGAEVTEALDGLAGASTVDRYGGGLRAYAVGVLRSDYGADVLRVARSLSEGRREGLQVTSAHELVQHLAAWLQSREKWPKGRAGNRDRPKTESARLRLAAKILRQPK